MNSKILTDRNILEDNQALEELWYKYNLNDCDGGNWDNDDEFQFEKLYNYLLEKEIIDEEGYLYEN